MRGLYVHSDHQLPLGGWMAGRNFLVTMSHGPPRTFASIEDFATQAAGHARNRILHACEAISWIGGLALRWKKPFTPVFAIKGAQVQDATAGAGEQAAHVLVGQITIDGNPPWALATSDAMKVAWLARFMVTSAVPTPFNAADSAAEKAGMKEAFRDACEHAWTNATKDVRDLTPIYEDFLEASDRAFQIAEQRKQGRRTLAFSKGDTPTSEERFVESFILRLYRVHGVTASKAQRMFPLKKLPA